MNNIGGRFNLSVDDNGMGYIDDADMFGHTTRREVAPGELFMTPDEGAYMRFTNGGSKLFTPEEWQEQLSRDESTLEGLAGPMSVLGAALGGQFLFGGANPILPGAVADFSSPVLGSIGESIGASSGLSGLSALSPVAQSFPVDMSYATEIPLESAVEPLAPGFGADLSPIEMQNALGIESNIPGMSSTAADVATNVAGTAAKAGSSIWDKAGKLLTDPMFILSALNTANTLFGKKGNSGEDIAALLRAQQADNDPAFSKQIADTFGGMKTPTVYKPLEAATSKRYIPGDQYGLRGAPSGANPYAGYEAWEATRGHGPSYNNAIRYGFGPQQNFFVPKKAEGGPVGLEAMMAGEEMPPEAMMGQGPELFSGFVPGADGGQADTVTIQVSPGEYVFDAETVSALGDGNTEAGARLLDEMRQRIREHKRAAPVDEIPPEAEVPEGYLPGIRG